MRPERGMRSISFGCQRSVQGLTTLMDEASPDSRRRRPGYVRLALAWCDEHDQIDALLQLSSLPYGLWLGRGLFREGLQWVERGLDGLNRAIRGAGPGARRRRHAGDLSG